MSAICRVIQLKGKASVKNDIVEWVRSHFDVRDVIAVRDYKMVRSDAAPVFVVSRSVAGRGIIGGSDRVVNVNNFCQMSDIEDHLERLIDAPRREGNDLYVYYLNPADAIAQFRPGLYDEPLIETLSVAAEYPALRYHLLPHPLSSNLLQRPCSVLRCSEDLYHDLCLDEITVNDLRRLARYQSGAGSYTDIVQY